MTRARLCLLFPILLSGACERGGRSTTTIPDGNEPAVGEDGKQVEGGEGLPIVAVPQRLPSTDPAMWVFDPSGRLIAEEYSKIHHSDLGCGIWDIESGTFVRGYDYDSMDEEAFNPCVGWDADPRSFSDTSADGKLRADVSVGLEIEVVDGPTRSIRGCASCEDAMVWAPSGHQLATSNGALLEIWDADAGKRLRSETLGLGDVIETLMGWTDEGLGVIVLHEISGTCEELEPDSDYCNYYGDGEDDEGDPEDVDGYALSTFWWPADGGRPLAQVEVYKSAELPDFYADVGVRWLAYSRYLEFDRDGTETTLYVHGVGPRQSQLGYTESGESDWVEAWEGHWRVDAATQWIEGLTSGSGGDYYGSLELGWNAIVAEPNPAMHHGQIIEIDGGGPWGEIEVLAASGGAAVARWEACIEEEGEACKTGGPPIGDCELLDISPLLSLALVDCEAGLRLIDAGGRGSTMATLGYDSSSDWRWGRDNTLALLEPDGKLGVVDLSTGKTLYERDDVLDLLEVPLAVEQERLALAYADHLEIVAGPTGARIIDVPGDWVAAALSPDGSKLAALGGQQLRVFDIATGSTIASAEVGDAYGVAWRQDGAALFYGHDSPTHALDPQTGELLYALDDPILEICDLEDIDPSWRWIHRPDGTITRTLDFAQIELGPTWARIESGMFEGERGDLPEDLRFRVGRDPDAPAIYTVSELEPWLRSPGLARAFFTGEPLPSPQIPAAELAKLETQKQSKPKRKREEG